MQTGKIAAMSLLWLLGAVAPVRAVEVLEDQSLTEIAGQDAVRLEQRQTTLSSSAPEQGDPIASAKKKVANENLDNIDNTLENARTLGAKAPEINDSPSAGVQKTMISGEYGFPKSIDTKSTHNAAPGHYSPGTFQQSNVKMEGSVKMSGSR